MSYAVKEVFYTLQGEGAQSGRAAVFCRFVGCNLWSGHEKDRATAVCKFCDTDFLGTDGPDGGKFDTEAGLADRIEQSWQSTSTSEKKFVVFTVGEPLLQLDGPLIDALHTRAFEIAVEQMEQLPRPTASIGSA
jgi:7-carboxy-7-deazaguanine synthase